MIQRDKGYGFIAANSGRDIFVQFTAIRADGHRILEEVQRVEFEIMQDDREREPKRVRVLWETDVTMNRAETLLSSGGPLPGRRRARLKILETQQFQHG